VEVDSITGLSTDCKAADEMLLTCDNTAQNGYVCESLGETFKVSGLKNTVIYEPDVAAQPPPAQTPESTGGSSSRVGKSYTLIGEEASFYVKKRDIVTFTHEDNVYTLTNFKIKSILTLTLNPGNREIVVGTNTGEVRVDVDGDGVEDLALTSTQIIPYLSTKLKIRILSAPAVAFPGPLLQASPRAPSVADSPRAPSVADIPAQEELDQLGTESSKELELRNVFLTLILILVIVAIAAVVSYFAYKKNKGEDEGF